MKPSKFLRWAKFEILRDKLTTETAYPTKNDFSQKIWNSLILNLNLMLFWRNRVNRWTLQRWLSVFNHDSLYLFDSTWSNINFIRNRKFWSLYFRLKFYFERFLSRFEFDEIRIGDKVWGTKSYRQLFDAPRRQFDHLGWVRGRKCTRRWACKFHLNLKLFKLVF